MRRVLAWWALLVGLSLLFAALREGGFEAIASLMAAR
jgi:hypothetical protein